jgi:hypothetical protein
MKSRYQYQHVPGNHGEPDMFDTFCTMYPTKQPSACYTNPSYFLLQDDMPMPARLLQLHSLWQVGISQVKMDMLCAGNWPWVNLSNTERNGYYPGSRYQECGRMGWRASLQKGESSRMTTNGELSPFYAKSQSLGNLEGAIDGTGWLSLDDQTLETCLSNYESEILWDPNTTSRLLPSIKKFQRDCDDAIDIAD